MPAHDSAFWRRLAHAGARYGPRFWVRGSPPVFGIAFALALPEARRRVRETLAWVRGPRSRLREELDTFRTFVSYAHCLAESLASGRPEANHPRIRVEGERHLTEALARGRGAVVVTAHAGPWDATARLLAAFTTAEVIVVMRPERDPAARALHDAARERGGVRVAHVGEHPLDALPLLRHLERGGLVAVQLDRGAPSGRTLDVALFGRPFRVPEGPFQLAALSGAPIVPLFAKRTGYFAYELVVHPAIELTKRADRAALERAAQRATDAMASFVRGAPTQWFRFAE
ncbi:MAG: lysophospholipid acyltransferase family protein [Pseudomonadota bacterium]